MQCKQKGCGVEAVAIAHWASGDTEQCEEHCRQLDGIAAVMGAAKPRFTSLETGQTMEFRE